MPEKTYASFIKRALAFSADGFILIVVVNLISIFIQTQSFDLSRATVTNQLNTTTQYLTIAFFISVFLYYVLFLSLNNGQTLGKYLLGVRVVKLSGKRVSFYNSLVRFFASIPSFLFFGIGILWALVDGLNQTWQDKFARTVVINKKVNIVLQFLGFIAAVLFWFIVLYFYSSTIVKRASWSFNVLQNASPIKLESLVVKSTIDEANVAFKRIRQENDTEVAKELSAKNVDSLKLALQQYPNNALLWKYLGDAVAWNNSLTQNNEDVAYAYKKAFELNPKNYVYALDLANTYLIQNDYEQAKVYYAKSIQINGSNNPVAFFGLGKVYSATGDYDQMVKNMEIAIEQFNYDNADGRYNDAVEQAQDFIDGNLIYGVN